MATELSLEVGRLAVWASPIQPLRYRYSHRTWKKQSVIDIERLICNQRLTMLCILHSNALSILPERLAVVDLPVGEPY